MLPLSKRVAWLCVVLTLWSALAFAVHHHADGEDSAHCPICVAALTASPAQPALAPRVTMLAVSTVETAPDIAAKQRVAAFALTVRPPPVR